ncbi:hypothetical protein Taro_018520 [Colocasia esculenta]|uniref:B box-type domain-containing protein n=1 Tax=Colocasia esculenta TaxID=4460 RepID=A0A843UQX6_COLES|nr:hypothetical protein [Colocasia esculenta]
MKIQCNACEAAEASVMCCADEAALCWACDDKVHAANELAGKHQRIPLTASSSSQVPKCDICQEASGYFFCLEDRALLCRECDVAIHSVNPFVSAHRRFLVTGVRLAPEHSELGFSFVDKQPSPAPPESLSNRNTSTPLSGENSEAVSSQVNRNGSIPASRTLFTGGTISGQVTNWPFNEFFGMEFNQYYGLSGHESSKDGSGKLGSSDDSQIYHTADEQLDFEINQVLETQWRVPEISSPPTASGLNWPKTSHDSLADIMSVPDVCASSAAIKCRRQSRRPA